MSDLDTSELASRGAVTRMVPHESRRATHSVTTSETEIEMSAFRGQWVWLVMRSQDATVVRGAAGTSGHLTTHGEEGFPLSAGVPEPFYVPHRGDANLFIIGAGADTLDILGP